MAAKVYRLIESNEALGTRKYLGDPFPSFESACERARERMGDPAKRRSFYALLVQCPDGIVDEVVRGVVV